MNNEVWPGHRVASPPTPPWLLVPLQFLLLTPVWVGKLHDTLGLDGKPFGSKRLTCQLSNS